MTEDGSRSSAAALTVEKPEVKPSHAPTRSFFSIPSPIKRVFDKFPLITYTENSLPIGAPRNSRQHVLYVFGNSDDLKREGLSYNPACLKWQTYLKVSEVPFTTVASNNHASPSGALPFLIPAESDDDLPKSSNPVPSNRLMRWISVQQPAHQTVEPPDVRYEPYASLIDNRLRKAWLYQLYLCPANRGLLRQLYVEPCSSNRAVQLTIERQLYNAAASEIVKASTSNTIVELELMRDAGQAFEALSTLLGENDWFFGQDRPGLLDTSVFAYTYLILRDVLAWRSNQLTRILEGHENLISHRRRILDLYY